MIEGIDPAWLLAALAVLAAGVSLLMFALSWVRHRAAGLAEGPRPPRRRRPPLELQDEDPLLAPLRLHGRGRPESGS